MTNPVVDLIGDRTGRIVPIYPQSEKAALTTWEIAGWVERRARALRRPRASPTRCPAEVRAPLDLRRSPDEAFSAIHLPETIGDKEQARRRLAFDELLRVQLVLVLRKRALEREARRHPPRRRRARSVGRFHDAPALRADRRAAAGDRRDRRRPRRAAPDAPPAAGRRRRRQDAWSR